MSNKWSKYRPSSIVTDEIVSKTSLKDVVGEGRESRTNEKSNNLPTLEVAQCSGNHVRASRTSVGNELDVGLEFCVLL